MGFIKETDLGAYLQDVLTCNDCDVKIVYVQKQKVLHRQRRLAWLVVWSRGQFKCFRQSRAAGALVQLSICHLCLVENLHTCNSTYILHVIAGPSSFARYSNKSDCCPFRPSQRSTFHCR